MFLLCFLQIAIWFDTAYSITISTTSFKSICFCQQPSGVYDPTWGYIIQLFLVSAAATGSNESIAVLHPIDLEFEVMTKPTASDCCPLCSDPSLNHRNLTDLCHHSCLYSHMVRPTLATVLQVASPILRVKWKFYRVHEERTEKSNGKKKEMKIWISTSVYSSKWISISTWK